MADDDALVPAEQETDLTPQRVKKPRSRRKEKEFRADLRNECITRICDALGVRRLGDSAPERKPLSKELRRYEHRVIRNYKESKRNDQDHDSVGSVVALVAGCCCLILGALMCLALLFSGWTHTSRDLDTNVVWYGPSFLAGGVILLVMRSGIRKLMLMFVNGGQGIVTTVKSFFSWIFNRGER